MDFPTNYGDMTFVAKEAVYSMPYHELEAVVRFINRHEDDMTDELVDFMDGWLDFLVDNL